jgi:hypothetical protein
MILQAWGGIVLDVETVRDFWVLFEQGGPSWLTLHSSDQSTLWNLFVPEGGGSRDSCLGGGEFKLLIEIVNPVPAGMLEF